MGSSITLEVRRQSGETESHQCSSKAAVLEWLNRLHKKKDAARLSGTEEFKKVGALLHEIETGARVFPWSELPQPAGNPGAGGNQSPGVDAPSGTRAARPEGHGDLAAVAPRRPTTAPAPAPAIPPQRPIAFDDAARIRVEEVNRELQSARQALVELTSGQHQLKTVLDTVTSKLRLCITTEMVREEFDARARKLQEQFDAQKQRIDEASARLESAREALEGEAEDQADFVRRYKPGLIEELRQKIGFLEEEQKTHRDQIAARNARIDELERKLVRAEAASGQADQDLLEREWKRLADERQGLEEAKAVRLERDQLRRELSELQAVESKYRQYQQSVEEDQNLRKQLHQAQLDVRSLQATVTGMRNEVEMCRQAKSRAEARAQLAEQRERDTSTALQVLRDEQAPLQDRVARIDAERQQLDELRRALAAERRELLSNAREDADRREQVQRETLYNLEQRADAERESLETTVRAELEARVSAELEQSSAENASLLARIEIIAASEKGLRAHVLELEREIQRCRDRERDLDARERRYESLQAEREDCARVLGNLRSQQQALEASVQALTSQLQSLGEQQREETSKHAKVLELSRHEHEKMLASAKLEHDRTLAQKQQAMDSLLADERNAVEALREERRRLSEPMSREARIRAMMEPVADLADSPERQRPGLDEMTWLNEVYGQIKEAGFAYPRGLFEAFHTSLKISNWAPITALAGVSGTGKSELPRLYSMFGGLPFVLVPVQPNWDSPQDLFGFFNYVDGKYKATRLLRALVQCQNPRRDGSSFDGMLMVLLDEMNLARVEYYFSELLSRLEARRGLDGTSAEGQLEIDVGSGEKGEHVTIGSNLLFVGTMNEDETTQTMSDKVIDRGNVITFPRPRALVSKAVVPLRKNPALLPLATWQSWVRSPAELGDFRPSIQRALERTNEGLAVIQRAISHRVLQAVENYVVNHPRVIAASSSPDQLEDACRTALAEQFMQRIMPKLRGCETGTKAGRRCLDAVKEVIGEHTTQELADAFREATHHPTFLWTSGIYREE